MFPGSIRRRVSAAHELLLQVELDFDPGARTFADLVPGTSAFADQPFESKILGLFQKLIEVFGETDRLSHRASRIFKSSAS
jgi:hypothetical protein